MSFPFNADIDQFSVTWRDARGKIAKNRFFVDFGASTGVTDAQSFEVTLLPLLKALTNAALQRTSGAESQYGVLQYGSHSPSDYQFIESKAVFVFQSSEGALHRFQIPAPKVTLFLPDRQTIDPTNAAVDAFTDYMITADLNGVFACTKDDKPFTDFIGGYFASRKLQRRVSIVTLDANLDPEEGEGP